MYKKININSNNIKTYSSKAVLIMCPNNSEYKGYCFWHPIKLFDTGVHSSSNRLVYNENTRFSLIKYGNGKYNKYEVLDRVEIDMETFEEMFHVMSENIKTKKIQNDFETHKPKELKPVEVQIDNDLLI